MNGARRIGLGTAQWGLDYGVTNTVGRPDMSGIGRMLQMATDAGIDTVDTAWAYGEAETLLGRAGAAERGFKIVTKTAIGSSGSIDIDAMVANFRKSLANLRCRQVDVLLVHNGSSLLEADGDRLWRALQDLRASGEASELGVSVYTPAELSSLLDRFDRS